jgi:uncharacterized protein (TIGR03437 family)
MKTCDRNIGTAKNLDGSPIGLFQLISRRAQRKICGGAISAVCLLLNSWPAQSQGIITTFAGNGNIAFSGDGGSATAASLNSPRGLAINSAGGVYISETANGRVRLVSAGMISTVAGNGIMAFSGDGGRAISASFSDVTGAALDSAGNLYLADASNRRVRRVTPAGIVTTIAGTGIQGDSGDQGLAINATLNRPFAVTLDAAGNLYICDSSNHDIRRVNLASGIITTYAGNGSPGFSGDGGQATAAKLHTPLGVAIDKSGNLYIADADNNCIRRVSLDGIIVTVAGNGNRAGFAGDGGAAASALLNIPSDVAVDSSGNLFIADAGNNRVRRVDGTSRIISTIAGGDDNGFSGDGGPATDSLLNHPWGMMVDTTGDVYVADMVNNRIRKISGAASVTPPPNTPLTIAPNMWTSIFGTGLSVAGDTRSWQSSDFMNNTMPTGLDGVSVTVNGKAAFISYISPSQVNFLTPPAAMQGPVSVVLSLYGAQIAGFTEQAQAMVPSFFQFGGGPYLAATHLNGSLVGPGNLYPGYTTPAMPGEIVVLYANGFGTTSMPVVSGSMKQSGSLSPLPAITIGGLPATVLYAGLAAPGEFQFNVVVPTSVAAGDTPITAAYGGLTTQLGALITIHQ